MVNGHGRGENLCNDYPFGPLTAGDHTRSDRGCHYDLHRTGSMRRMDVCQEFGLGFGVPDEHCLGLGFRFAVREG